MRSGDSPHVLLRIRLLQSTNENFHIEVYFVLSSAPLFFLVYLEKMDPTSYLFQRLSGPPWSYS